MLKVTILNVSPAVQARSVSEAVSPFKRKLHRFGHSKYTRVRMTGFFPSKNFRRATVWPFSSLKSRSKETDCPRRSSIPTWLGSGGIESAAKTLETLRAARKKNVKKPRNTSDPYNLLVVGQ